LVRSAPLDAAHVGAVVEGCVMGAWEQRARQTSAAGTALQELKLAGFAGADPLDVEFSLRLGEATNQARDLQHMAPNELGPERIAGIAGELARRHGMEFEALGTDQLVTEGYRLMVAAGAGSGRESQLVRVHYRGSAQGNVLAMIGLAHGGAGSAGAAGAAAVLAAIDAIADAHLPIQVIAVIAAVESVTDGLAQRAGTVWASASGKTVEVAGPGAAAYLGLGDAITFALRRGATHLVDLATLTSGQESPLGPIATPVVCADGRLWEVLARASELAGERTWPLPTYAEYRSQLRSRVADLRTPGPGEAATIRSAMFLHEFAERRPWAHLEVAAGGWHERHDVSGLPRGPLGSGTRTLIRLAELFRSMSR
jgi:leucyl aminopeptidase